MKTPGAEGDSRIDVSHEELEALLAAAPEGVGEEKYDETAASMIAMLRYGSGFPWNRLEGLQENLGISLPAATQCEIVKETAVQIQPKEFLIPVPPLPLQQKFAALVERVECLRAVQREALRQAEHLFASLLHRAFSG